MQAPEGTVEGQRCGVSSRLLLRLLPGCLLLLRLRGLALLHGLQVTAVIDWVEKGVAPDSLVAKKIVNGQVTRSRPLCPYPQVARYRGQGSTDDAANFECKAP